MKTYGIDVSKWQGAINWKTVASALKTRNSGNPGFAILRIGTTKSDGGLSPDKEFLNNVTGCEENGIPWGVYFYSYDHSAAASTKSTKQVISTLKSLSSAYKPLYPIYIDVEYEAFNTGKDGSGRSNTQVKADNTAIITASLEELETAGYYAGVYCSRDFFKSYTNLSQLEKYSKWEAAYSNTDTSAVSNHMWQYSSKNALGIPGFGQSLDCDVCYLDFPTIIKNAGLNGWPKVSDPKPETPEIPSEPTSSVDWDSDSNDFVITATKGDRKALQELCDKLKLPVRNL